MIVNDIFIIHCIPALYVVTSRNTNSGIKLGLKGFSYFDLNLFKRTPVRSVGKKHSTKHCISCILVGNDNQPSLSAGVHLRQVHGIFQCTHS